MTNYLFLQIKSMFELRSLKLLIGCFAGVICAGTIAEADPADVGQRTSISAVGSPCITEPYAVLNGGKFEGPLIKESLDPLVRYRWKEAKETDKLQIYFLKPVKVFSGDKNSFIGLPSATADHPNITVSDVGTIRLDFGIVSGAWLEFDSPDCPGDIEMGISEHDEPGIGKAGIPVKHGNTYRLELNPELYDGLRFGWIKVKSTKKPWHITGIRAVCQVKPTNYNGSFACSDPLLTKSWYLAAYSVKVSLCKDYFGSILMDRGDRMSWTGDAHTSQAAALVAFGNFDFIRKNIENTADQSNGIRSYSLYWIFSLMDYYYYSGDSKTLERYLGNVCGKLDDAYGVYGKTPDLRFYGWDERLCAGFEIWFRSCPEAQSAFKMLSIRAWNDFGEMMAKYGRNDLSNKYLGYAKEKMTELRQDSAWAKGFGLHAAADAINTGLLTPQEKNLISGKLFQDRVNRVSFSPFNQYFVNQAMARSGRYDEALSSARDMWGGMVRNGASTTYEVYRPSWNDGIAPGGALPNGQSGIISLCHPWGAGVVKWLNEEILGIVPTSPGFKTYDILPHPGRSLTRVSGETPTAVGGIIANFDFTSGKCFVSAPKGTIGRVGIPKLEKSVRSIHINGKLAWDGTYHLVGGIGGANEDGNFVYFTSVEPGRYSIAVNYLGTTPTYQESPLTYAAKFGKLDSVTSGNWGGVYGKDGHVLCNYLGGEQDKKSLPKYVSSVDYFRAFPKNGMPEGKVWNANTLDKRALASDSTNRAERKASCYLNTDNTMCFTVHADGSKEYQVTLYFVDWEKCESRLAVEMFDAESLDLIAPVKILDHFSGGMYLVYKYGKSAKFRINKIKGDGVTLSGIFFDASKGD
jgi:alpha-L-rhamnosidase